MNIDLIIDVDFCQNWQGYAYADKYLSEKGFIIHRVYKRILRSICEEFKEKDNLDEYFLEVAREFISSGSFDKNDVDRGAFRRSIGYYNSEYLDKLSKYDNGGLGIEFYEGCTEIPILHKGLRLFFKKMDQDVLFREKFSSSINSEFENEIVSFEKDNTFLKGLIGKNLFNYICRSFGFVETKNNARIKGEPNSVFSINLDNGLIFYLYMDRIVNPSKNNKGFFNAPVAIGFKKIVFRRDRQLGNMSYLLPGIDRYCNNIPDGGFFVAFSAYLTCVMAIASSFEG